MPIRFKSDEEEGRYQDIRRKERFKGIDKTKEKKKIKPQKESKSKEKKKKGRKYKSKILKQKILAKPNVSIKKLDPVKAVLKGRGEVKMVTKGAEGYIKKEMEREKKNFLGGYSL